VALAAGAACQVFVRFTPSAPGDAGAVLHLTDAAGTAYDVPLAGFAIGGLTRIELHSEPGDFVGGGTDRVFTPADAAIRLAGDRQAVGMAFSGAAGANWNATFGPAPGDIIAPGAYPGATRYGFNTVGPGLDVSGDGRGCNTLTGSFTVTTATFAPDGKAQSLGASFVQHCEGAVPALTGTLAFRVGAVLPPPGLSLFGGSAGAPPVVGAPGPASVAVPSAPPPAPAVNAAAVRTPRACARMRFTAARVLSGTARSERIRGTAHGDLIIAGAGNDRVLAGGGSDCVDGGTGADVLERDAGADVLAGDAGRDRLLGGAGADHLQGGAGDDRLDGGQGRDVLDCGPGRDVAVVTRGDVTRGCERVIRRRS
jgi:RTX calcium-binding nonapeptide repeat (4 copies)